jgi:hypothetical protein
MGRQPVEPFRFARKMHQHHQQGRDIAARQRFIQQGWVGKEGFGVRDHGA